MSGPVSGGSCGSARRRPSWLSTSNTVSPTRATPWALSCRTRSPRPVRYSTSRGLDVPVLFTIIAYAPGLNDLGIWREKAPALADLVEGTRATAIDDRLARTEHEPLITKKGPSGLFGTPLASMLIERRTDTVVLCGATTSGCVRATAVDLLSSGFRTVIPRQCVGDRVQAAHESSLIDLNAKYCDVMEANEVVDYLQSVKSDSVSTHRP